MNAPSKVPESPTVLRAAALLLGLVAAWAAAVFMKQPAFDADTVKKAPGVLMMEKSPVEILKALPPIQTGSETDQALSTAIAKVHGRADVAALWVDLGDCLAQKLRDTADQTYYLHAGAVYGQALKLEPRNVDALTGMAWVAGGRHDFDRSIEWANKALAVEPGAVAARGILGDAALELGDYDKALDQYQAMMDLRPDLSSWSRGAWLLWLTGDKGRAMWLMDKAIKSGAPFAENSAWCRARLAMMHFNDGALVPAEQVLAPALKASPHNTHVLLAAGRIASAKQDIPSAVRSYETILESGPHHEALVALGDLHAARGEIDQAEQCYQKVEALHAAHLASGAHDHMQMARFLADHDRNLVEALRLAEQHKLTKNVIEADTLAWVYFKNGDQPRAIESIKRALSQGTPDPEIHFHAGMIAEAAGDLVSARRHLLQAIGMNPQFHPLHAPIAARTLDRLASSKPSQTASTVPAATKP